MMTSGLNINGHAVLRMSQRNVNADTVGLVLRLGRIEHRAGAEFYFLGRRDVPEGMEQELERGGHDGRRRGGADLDRLPQQAGYLKDQAEAEATVARSPKGDEVLVPAAHTPDRRRRE